MEGRYDIDSEDKERAGAVPRKKRKKGNFSNFFKLTNFETKQTKPKIILNSIKKLNLQFEITENNFM